MEMEIKKPTVNIAEYLSRIMVSDFDQKYSEQIFGMFKRLHLNTEFEGTGIGLALCKKIVEKHNGYISARSKINEGSTFIISLPLEQQNVSLSERFRQT